MKIIVQAGGLGSRMMRLAETKPKSLIPAMYLPIIFHLFQKFPSDEFIVVGDYKFDVFDQYLATFASDTNYMLLKAKGKGNAAGLKDAISYVPADEPLIIIWSDIILSEQFNVREVSKGCQVGVVDFPCSWSLINGKLVNKEHRGLGVAGFYLFDSKTWFDDLPAHGSFTDWLADKDIPLKPISLMGSIDVGTLDAYNQISTTAYRSRPYNKIEFKDGKVTKTGLTSEARRFIEREVAWYACMENYGFSNIPHLHHDQPLTMEMIRGQNIFAAELEDNEKGMVLDKLVAALSAMHGYDNQQSSPWDIYGEYFTKTLKRLRSIAAALPFAFDSDININGVSCFNVLRSPHRLRRAVQGNLMDARYAPIHGDCQLTNTLLSDDGNVFFIDPRGYFGSSEVLGDVRYDWAKLYYSISGNFDQFNIKNYELVITEDCVNYRIGSSGWEHLTGRLLAQIPSAEGNIKELKLIHAIVWLSMASHAWEDFDSMCIAFYNGTWLLSDWFREFGDAAH